MSLRNMQVQNSETNHLIVILGMHLTVIIIIIVFIAFMQDIYYYIPERNHVFRVYIVLQLFCIDSLCYTSLFRL